MKRTFLKVLSVFLLLFCCCSVFANGESETITNNAEKIKINSLLSEYIDNLAKYQEDYEKCYTKMQMAYNKSDADEYLAAKKELMSLVAPSVSKEDSEIIEKQIVESNDIESAKLLYQYSRYYRPVLTFVSNEEGFSYRSSITINPGSSVTLPTLNIAKKSLIFKGWGTEEGVVLYEAGSQIDMPISSLTLYAVFEVDTSLKSGSSIDITIDNEALEIEQGVLTNFSFKIKNNGTEDLSNVEVSFESDDPLLVILTDRLSARYIESCGERIANYTLISKAVSGTQLNGVITVKDSNDHCWTKDVTLVVK